MKKNLVLVFAIILLFITSCSSGDSGNPADVQAGEIKINLKTGSYKYWPEDKSVVVDIYKNDSSEKPVISQAAAISSEPSGYISISVQNVDYGTYKYIRLSLLNNPSNTIQKTLAEYSDVSVSAASTELPEKEVSLDIDMSLYTYQMIQNDIFNTKCVSCHSVSNPLGGLDISSGNSYNNMAGVTSAYDPSYKLVTPGDTTNSYLYMTLIPLKNAPLMPPLPLKKLTAEEIEIIALWIATGAKNN
jgi:uncharacterized membrane protein